MPFNKINNNIFLLFVVIVVTIGFFLFYYIRPYYQQYQVIDTILQSSRWLSTKECTILTWSLEQNLVFSWFDSFCIYLPQNHTKISIDSISGGLYYYAFSQTEHIFDINPYTTLESKSSTWNSIYSDLDSFSKTSKILLLIQSISPVISTAYISIQ